MEARAHARYVRVTPQKARRVIDVIRGMNAADAQAVLAFAPQAASEPIGKVVASAVANAANNHQMDARELVISAAFVDEGPTMKRIRPRAQGRAYRVRKRTSHITVIVSDGREVVVKPKAVAKKALEREAAAEAAEKPAKKAADAKPAAKKAPAKKAADAKPAAKKAPAKKAADAKPAAKKAPAKKAADAKPAAKKAPAKKTAAKKTEKKD